MSKQQFPAQDTVWTSQTWPTVSTSLDQLARNSGSSHGMLYVCLQLRGLLTPWTLFFYTSPGFTHLTAETHSFIGTDSEIALLVKPLDIPTAAHRQSCPLLLLFIPPFPVTGDLTPCCGICLLIPQATVSSVRENSTPYALSLSPWAKQYNSTKCFLN